MKWMERRIEYLRKAGREDQIRREVRHGLLPEASLLPGDTAVSERLQLSTWILFDRQSNRTKIVEVIRGEA